MATATMAKTRRAALSSLSGQEMWQGNAIEMQEQDRLRISQELHDDLGQRLALLEMQLSQLADRCACPETAKGLRVVRDRVGEMDRDVHRICCQLYPVVLEKLGLVIALKSLCREFCEMGISTEFVHENCPTNVSKPVSLCLYRVVQEALHNVSKHANTNYVRVSLRASSGRLEAVVQDFGVGFDRDVIRPTSGLGLSSIEERAKKVGGRIFVDSAVGAGTQVRAVFQTMMVAD